MAPLLGLPDDRWLEPALSLNFHPEAWVHESWLQRFQQRPIVDRIWGKPGGATALSRYLLQTFKLDGSYCEDFSGPFSRLALLDGNSLSSLFLHVGLVLRSEGLREQISGEAVRGLRSAVGDEAYAFAIRTAPLLGKIPSFRYEPEATDPASRFSLIGARYCWSTSPKPGEGLLRRALLKLPVGWARPLAVAWDDQPQGASTGQLPPLVLKILGGILPTWRPLFV
jgi:YOP proteins translocation protein K (YscK)